MRRIRETLRLHLQAGLSYNEVGRALKISKSVVGNMRRSGRLRRPGRGLDLDIKPTQKPVRSRTPRESVSV